MSDIILPSGGYRKLKAYAKAEVIYQGTVAFCRRFLPAYGDRTVDQMTQAARSCKQNIAEGSSTSGTSKESEIRLTGVAKVTLDELMEDYQDYLTKHGLAEWPLDDPRKTKLRNWTKAHNELADYTKSFETGTAEQLCNLMMTLIHQEYALLKGMLARQQADFKKLGGIRERMARARHEARSDGLEAALYSRLQEAETPGQLTTMITTICRTAHQIGARLKKARNW